LALNINQRKEKQMEAQTQPPSQQVAQAISVQLKEFADREGQLVTELNYIRQEQARLRAALEGLSVNVPQTSLISPVGASNIGGQLAQTLR
jgi:hypothetical protein